MLKAVLLSQSTLSWYAWPSSPCLGRLYFLDVMALQLIGLHLFFPALLIPHLIGLLL